MRRDNLENRKRCYVFGAHPRGWTFYEYMKTLKPQYEMLGFIYDNEEVNPSEIDRIPIVKISYQDKGDVFDLDAKVYIATRGDYHLAIKDRLQCLGFRDIECVTPELDILLRNQYVDRKFREKGKDFCKINADDRCVGMTTKTSEFGNACVCIAKTRVDGDFETPVPLRPYESIIQAGCTLTDVRLPDAKFFDNEVKTPGGADISYRNTQCCELTALYWIWKNGADDFAGIEHWRRRFLLPDDWTELMKREGIDVILPVPLCVMPSLEENFKERHVPKVWDTAMEILREVHPDEYERAVLYFRENSLYSPCNMLIARKAVLDDYCAWMFPVVLELNDRIGEIADRYQNRYPGFVSERLLTYFFDSRSDKYKVAYADKSFLR